MKIIYPIVVDAEILSSTPNSEYPVVALLALGNDVKLGILPNSHNIVMFENVVNLSAAIEYKIKLGEIILINPILVHYGCAYVVNENSLRAHYYFDNPAKKRKGKKYERQTFFFNAPVQRTPREQATKIKRRKNRRGDNKRRKQNIGGLA